MASEAIKSVVWVIWSIWRYLAQQAKKGIPLGSLFRLSFATVCSYFYFFQVTFGLVKLPPFAFIMLSVSCKMSLLLITKIDNIQCYLKWFTYFSFQLKTLVRQARQYRQRIFQLTCNLLQLPRMSWRKRKPNVTIKTKDLNWQIHHHGYFQWFIL